MSPVQSVSYAEDLLYPSYLDRLLIKSLGVQAGVVEAEDMKVSAGSGLQVNIKAGKAFVAQTNAIEESSNSFFNGLYMVPSSTESNPYNFVEVSAVNPQIAQIILRVYDVGELKSSGQSYARFEWLNGTPTVNATEAKMKEGIYEGAAALPQSSFRLASVLVPKNSTKSSEYYIQDRRLWSYGALAYQKRTTGAIALTSVVAAYLSSELALRVECSGAPLELSLHGVVETEKSTGGAVAFGMRMDGTSIDGITDGEGIGEFAISSGSAVQAFQLDGQYIFIPSAGSHLFRPTYKLINATCGLASTASRPVLFRVQELLAKSANNGTV